MMIRTWPWKCSIFGSLPAPSASFCFFSLVFTMSVPRIDWNWFRNRQGLCDVVMDMVWIGVTGDDADYGFVVAGFGVDE